MPTLPLFNIVTALVVVVAVPSTEVVAKYKLPPAFLNAHCDRPAPADNANCGAVAEVGFNNHCGVVVPMPTLPPAVAKYAEPVEVRAVVEALVAVNKPVKVRGVDVAAPGNG